MELADAAVKSAVISISGVAGDMGELVAEGLSYEGGGDEGTVSEGGGAGWVVGESFCRRGI